MKRTNAFKIFSIIAVLALASCDKKGNDNTDNDPGYGVEETVYVDPTQVVVPEGCFHTKTQLAFMQSSIDTVGLFATGNEDLSNPAGNVINFTKTGGVLLQVSTFNDFHEDEATPYLDTRMFDITDHEKARVKNLLSDTTYYWRTFTDMATDGEALETGSFKTCDCLPRFIDIDDISSTKYVTNVRDMGGYATYLDGYTKVKQGYIYRSGRMSGSTSAPRAENTPNERPVTDTGKPSMLMSEAGYDMLTKTLGIKGEIDLRNNKCKDNNDGSDYYVENGNRAKYEDVIPGVKCCDAGIYAEKSALLQDLDSKGLDSGYAQIKLAFDFYSDPNNYPNFVHCYIGTDRTGCVCYLLECLLGVSDEMMYRDYLWSNFGLIGGTRDLSAIRTYEKVLKGYGKATMAENCEALLKSDKIGISDEQIKTIRDTLLVKAN